MSIYSKPISQIDTADLQELLSEKGVESVRLEFKCEPPSKDDMLKKLSSFANAYGGYLVVGAEASSKDGRILGLPGVDPQPSYKQTVVQWCSEGASPPLSVEVSDPIAASSGGGKVCYVIYTPESDLVPHFLNGRKGVYIRTDEFSSRFDARMATESELRHLMDRRKLIRERRENLLARARRRFESYTECRYRELNPGRESIGARFDLSLVPRYPARPVCDHPRLLSLLKQDTIEWRRTCFPRDPAGIISQHESAIALRAGSRFSMIEANTWGLLF